MSGIAMPPGKALVLAVIVAATSTLLQAEPTVIMRRCLSMLPLKDKPVKKARKKPASKKRTPLKRG